MDSTPLRSILVSSAVLVLCACATTGPDTPVQQGYFFTGGRYVETKSGPLMERQMYVEYRIPARKSSPIRSS